MNLASPGDDQVDSVLPADGRRPARRVHDYSRGIGADDRASVGRSFSSAFCCRGAELQFRVSVAVGRSFSSAFLAPPHVPSVLAGLKPRPTYPVLDVSTALDLASSISLHAVDRMLGLRSCRSRIQERT